MPRHRKPEKKPIEAYHGTVTLPFEVGETGRDAGKTVIEDLPPLVDELEQIVPPENNL